MCRLLAWIGAPRTVSEVVLEPEFGLLRQSYAPRAQAHGLMNADGWGVVLWAGGAPARWRSTRPLWQDSGASFGAMAPLLTGTCILASVRSATTGMPVEETATAPFTRGSWAMTHNGVVDRSAIPAGSMAPESTCDSAVLAAYLLDAPGEAAARIAEVGVLDPCARLTTLLSDGRQVVGVRWGDPLVWRTDLQGTWVCSEAVDDQGGWTQVPDRHVITVSPDGTVNLQLIPTTPSSQEHITVSVTVDRHLSPSDLAASLEKDVRAGLAANQDGQLSLPPKWFYDAAGGDLFDQITRLPEYYPTRAEHEILETHAAEIAAATGADTLVELGSGTSDKTRLLLDALTAAGTLASFVPLDVDETTLIAAGESITAAYPGIEVRAVVGDFTQHLDQLPTSGKRVIAFLGSTIGNFPPAERAFFLKTLAATLGSGDAFLLGTDLVKDPARLVAAYDDAAGVTAAFNRNVLRVVDRELGADFDADRWVHESRWNATEEWIEMHLRTDEDRTVHVAKLGIELEIAAGSTIHTEISSKFTRARVEAELAEAGLRLTHWWTDAAGDFGLSLSVPA